MQYIVKWTYVLWRKIKEGKGNREHKAGVCVFAH